MDSANITSSALAVAADNTTISAIIAPQASSHAIGIMGSLSSGIYWILQLHYWVLTFVTFTLPTFLFTLFSTSFSFNMNFTTLLAIFLLFGSGISWVVRYRYLNMYARLPPEPQRKEPQIDLFPDSQEGDSKAGLSTYLDEFLSAIKVFGYLERPVFHELTRHMQTRKLIAGETFMLEEEKGFCLVVDGLVQVFVKSNAQSLNSTVNMLDDDDEDSDEQMDGGQGYQLLTEVKNGAPLSSLFTILSLFTEDVQLRQAEEDLNHLTPPTPDVGKQGSYVGLSSSTSAPHSPHFSHHDLSEGLKGIVQNVKYESTTANESTESLPTVPPLSLLTDEQFHSSRPQTPGNMRPSSAYQNHDRPTRPVLKKSKSVHPNIIGRATVDTTIAVIPAAAFKRLTTVYPKASGHIVSVILTRFLRVTFSTARTYLGLTGEVLRTEANMHKYTSYELPNRLRGEPLTRLKERFTEEIRKTKTDDELQNGVVLNHQPSLTRSRHRRTSSVSRKELSLHAKIIAARGVNPYGGVNYSQTPGGQGNANPGDLWSNVPFYERPTDSTQRTETRRASYFPPTDVKSKTWKGKNQTPPLESTGASQKSDDFAGVQEAISEIPEDDEQLKEAVLECILKAIGLGTVRNGTIRPPQSVEQSPRLVSYDARKQKAVFNSFGFMAPLDGDGDTDSVTSAASTPGAPTSFMDLKDQMEVVFFTKGSVLIEQGERSPGIFYLIDGFLDVSMNVPEEPVSAGENNLYNSNTFTSFEDLPTKQQNSRPKIIRKMTKSSMTEKKNVRKSLFMIKPGGLAGYIGSISGSRSLVGVTAKTDAYVGFLPRSTIERIVDKNPLLLLTMAKRLTSLLPRLILHIDFALEWLQVDAGQVIYHQNDDSDAIYIVLNGRLRAVRENSDGDMQVEGEFGQGESVGELEVLTESSRPATLHAIRDTEIARFPKTLFNTLALEHPGITMQISRIIASRMRSIIDNPVTFEPGGENQSLTRKMNSKMNLRTVCVLPVTAGVPITEFSQRLAGALRQVNASSDVAVHVLNQATVLNHLGRHAFSRIGKLKLAGYLADLEEKYRMVLYVADTSVNAPWTQTCISQADRILLVGMADSDPAIGEYERFLVGMKTTARKELVLLHPERFCKPGSTRQWLRNRMWINGGHHHIQMSFRSSEEPVQQPKGLGNIVKKRVQMLGTMARAASRMNLRAPMPIYSQETSFKDDFQRLARRLCGKTIGLVLGGGGARGITQVGVIRAMEEAGIPIDIIGGTSIGSFVGGLYARDADIVPVYGWAKKFSGRMASLWRFVLDLTYPSVSYTTGHEFNRGIFKTFGNSQIEDFWLEFYCNTTSISKSRQEFHTSGYAWRYIRASMSLAGLLPPLCDEGSMLLDGGYVDNLTVAHMKSLGANIIFAVDVGSIDDNVPQAYGDTLSGFWTFFNRWNMFSSHPNPPTLAEIQARLAYVSSITALERAKVMPGCFYMRPPIDPYGTLDFGKFDEMYKVGYEYGKKYLEELKESEEWPKDVLGGGDGEGEGGAGSRGRGFRRINVGRRASI